MQNSSLKIFGESNCINPFQTNVPILYPLSFSRGIEGNTGLKWVKTTMKVITAVFFFHPQNYLFETYIQWSLDFSFHRNICEGVHLLPRSPYSTKRFIKNYWYKRKIRFKKKHHKMIQIFSLLFTHSSMEHIWDFSVSLNAAYLQITISWH